MATLADKLKGMVTAVWQPRPELLLMPNVPKPMHGVAPRVVLGEKWWNAERQRAYQSTGFHCAACGVLKYEAKSRQWLEAHEVYEINYVKGLMKFVETTPLCHYCHNYIHSGRLQWLLQAGKIHQSKYTAIIIHGDRVLNTAGLKKQGPYDGDCAEWKKWRLVIGRKKFPPRFKSLAELERHYNDAEE